MAGTTDKARLEERWRDILAVHARTQGEIDRALHPYGLGASDFEVLDLLASATPPPGELCRVQNLVGRVHLSQSALSRLMAVSERYPTLQANQGFRDLRVTLEGTENRITVARNRYIQTVQEYNVLARSFPTNLTAKIFSYAPKSNFSVQNEAQISTPPAVDFNKK